MITNWFLWQYYNYFSNASRVEMIYGGYASSNDGAATAEDNELSMAGASASYRIKINLDDLSAGYAKSETIQWVSCKDKRSGEF